MLPIRKKEMVHSLVTFILLISALFLILLSKQYFQIVGIWVGTLFYFNYLKIETKKMGKYLLFAMAFSFTYFLLNLLFPKDYGANDQFVYFFKMKISVMQLSHAAFITFKIIALSHLSMCSNLVINYTNIILYLISKNKMETSSAYPLLVAINSIVLIKEEFYKIQINARQRKFSFSKRVNTLFPLMVFAIRHSQRGALSLVTRGLNETRSFYYQYDLDRMDKIIFGLCLLSYLMIYGIFR